VRGDTGEVGGLLKRWTESGLKAAEFARREGVNAGTLSYWKWRLRREGRRTALASSVAQRRWWSSASLGTSFPSITKPHSFQFDTWWRRRESNPRPKAICDGVYVRIP
jgi:hypothetical protein